MIGQLIMLLCTIAVRVRIAAFDLGAKEWLHAGKVDRLF